MDIDEVLSHKGVDLCNEFVAYIDDRIGQDAGLGQLHAWEALPEVFKQYHALSALDSEVFNGGFEQYYGRYAGYPPFIGAAIRGLELVGSPAHAKLAREAIAIFVHYFPKLQPLLEQLGISLAPKLTETDIDARFYEVGDLLGIQMNWIAANRDTIRGLAQQSVSVESNTAPDGHG